MRSRAHRPVRLMPEVQQAIRTLHPELKRRIRAALDRLAADPTAGKPLTRELEGWRTWRVGRARIIYREARTVIEVVAIGPRASIYVQSARALRSQRKQRDS